MIAALRRARRGRAGQHPLRAVAARAGALLGGEAANTTRGPTGPRQALLERCWDERRGLFLDLAGRDQRPVKISTWSSLAPLALPRSRTRSHARLSKSTCWTPAATARRSGSLRSRWRSRRSAPACTSSAAGAARPGCAPRGCCSRRCAASATRRRRSRILDSLTSSRRTRRVLRVLQPAHGAGARGAPLRLVDAARRPAPGTARPGGAADDRLAGAGHRSERGVGDDAGGDLGPGSGREALVARAAIEERRLATAGAQLLA